MHIAEVAAAVSLLAAIVYPFLNGESFWRAAIKTAAVGGLACVALANGAGDIALALALCAVGDFALARPGDRWFVFGMLAFGAGHVVYALLFSGWFVGMDALRWFAVAILGGLALLLGQRFSRLAGDLAWPVRIYVALIAAMGIAAIGLPFSVVTLGAALFVLSDSIIGQQKFLKRSWHGQDLAIWSTYYIGQFCILLGWLTPVRIFS